MPDKDSSRRDSNQPTVWLGRDDRVAVRNFGYGSILTNQALAVVVLDGKVLLSGAPAGAGRRADARPRGLR